MPEQRDDVSLPEAINIHLRELVETMYKEAYNQRHQNINYVDEEERKDAVLSFKDDIARIFIPTSGGYKVRCSLQENAEDIWLNKSTYCKPRNKYFCKKHKLTHCTYCGLPI